MVWEQSRTAQVLQTVTTTLAEAREGSVLAASVERLTTRATSVVRTSYCYRWLTAEPDPEVIVIDLRKTRTVGPFITLLEKVVDPVERVWAGSQLPSVTATAGAAVSRSRTGRILSALLEPPDPPANDTDEKTE